MVMSVVFSHNSRQLVSASCDCTVKIWDAETGKCMQMLEGHGQAVRSVVFSHDSRRLASASRDRTVKIWDANTAKCLQTLEGHETFKIAFDPTGSYLFTDLGLVPLDNPSSVHSIGRESNNVNMIPDTSAPLDGVEAHPEPQLYGYGLSLDRLWITRHGENWLWLPSEYRPGEFAISGTTIEIGCGTGRVLVTCFSPTVSPSGNTIT
jgi:WD40 repeat protein